MVLNGGSARLSVSLTVPFLSNKRERTRQVLSEETLGNIGVRFEAPTRQYLKTVIPENRCIKVICIGSHTTASSETIETYSCAKTPGSRLRCDSTVLYEVLWKSVKW